MLLTEGNLTMTALRYATNPALALTDTPLADLSHPWTGPMAFDHFQARFGYELWPLPEVSHTQFLRDHDHAQWLADFDTLAYTLRVVDLERPWSVDRVGENAPFKWVGCCDLCDYKSKPKPKQQDAEMSARQHARARHGWSSPKAGI